MPLSVIALRKKQVSAPCIVASALEAVRGPTHQVDLLAVSLCIHKKYRR